MPYRIEEVEIVKQRLSDGPRDELLEEIASIVVDHMDDSFPELSLKSRPMDKVLHEFREKKLAEVDSKNQYNRKFDYLERYLVEKEEIETTEELRSEDIDGYNYWRKYSRSPDPNRNQIAPSETTATCCENLSGT